MFNAELCTALISSIVPCISMPQRVNCKKGRTTVSGIENLTEMGCKLKLRQKLRRRQSLGSFSEMRDRWKNNLTLRAHSKHALFSSGRAGYNAGNEYKF
jgi:hypothetical protein